MSGDTPLRVLQFGWENTSVRWCDRPNVAAARIVAYDLLERTPRERAKMLRRLGLRHIIWDWRDEHALLFDAELDALRDQGVEVGAVWAPHPLPDVAEPDHDARLGVVNAHVRQFVVELARRGLTPDLWVPIEYGQEGEATEAHPAATLARVWRAADHLEPLVRLAAENGMCVLLTNHLGFFGEPRNLAALVEALTERGLRNVGIAYQQHHGHAHIANFEEHLASMLPHLVAIVLSGMDPDGIAAGRKILPFGAGRADRKLAHLISKSGWKGQLAVQCHSLDDAEERLLDSLEGLAWVVDRQDGKRHHRPVPRIAAPAWPTTVRLGDTPSTPDSAVAEPIHREEVSMHAPDPYTAGIHALLTHLEAVGFRGAPRSFGWDDQGRHLVEWIHGTRADHPAAPDEALDPRTIGAFMREMHDALASFVPPADVRWFEGIPAPGADLVIHQDIAPSNIVVTPDGRLVAIDWDAAAPGTRLWDIAQAVHAFAPLSRGGLEPEASAERLARFAEGYRMDELQRAQLLPLLSARSERMYEYLDGMRVTGESPWIELWERGVGAVWKSDAQWIREHETHWREALLV
jgi:hypothetical protein